jgi:hypothetical protein
MRAGAGRTTDGLAGCWVKARAMKLGPARRNPCGCARGHVVLASYSACLIAESILIRQLNMANHFSHPRSREGGNLIFLTRRIPILGSRPAQPLWLFAGAGIS